MALQSLLWFAIKNIVNTLKPVLFCFFLSFFFPSHISVEVQTSAFIGRGGEKRTFTIRTFTISSMVGARFSLTDNIDRLQDYSSCKWPTI